MLKALIWAMAAAVAVSGAGSALAADATAPIPSYITAAVADPGRPAADKERDSARKPAEMLTWAGVQPGDKVIELIPGGGYYSRLLSKAVGDQGHVYELIGPAPPDNAPERAKEMAAKRNKAIEDIASNYDNVTLNRDPFTSFSIPEPADLFWTSQNYHDLNIFGTDMAAFNKAVFDALKPGGIYIVIDHAGNPGLKMPEMGKLHRIDEAMVKKQVEAAGFKLISESKALHNTTDNHTKPIFVMHDKTDRFALKFQKPEM